MVFRQAAKAYRIKQSSKKSRKRRLPALPAKNY
jgi:hypothetical protein